MKMIPTWNESKLYCYVYQIDSISHNSSRVVHSSYYSVHTHNNNILYYFTLLTLTHATTDNI